MLTLDDVVGLQKQREVFEDALILPLQKKDMYNKLIKQPDKVEESKNFLIYGPPGSGKTHFMRCFANTYDLPFVLVEAPRFLQELQGRGARMVRELYEKYTQGVIFVDEADAIGRARDFRPDSLSIDILLQFTLCMEGPGTNYDTATVFSTNMKELLDKALISRIPIEHQLFFPLPDAQQRKRIIEKRLSYYNNRINDVDYLLAQTKGYDGRQIKGLIARAGRRALKLDREYILEDDFYGADAIA